MRKDSDNHLFFVIAGSDDEAILWAKGRGIDPTKFVSIESPSQLVMKLEEGGLAAAGKDLWLVGKYHERERFEDLIRYAKELHMEVRYPHTWVD